MRQTVPRDVGRLIAPALPLTEPTGAVMRILSIYSAHNGMASDALDRYH